jgi:hypothetical protein
MSAMGKGDIVIAKTHVRSKAQKRTAQNLRDAMYRQQLHDEIIRAAGNVTRCGPKSERNVPLKHL